MTANPTADATPVASSGERRRWLTRAFALIHPYWTRSAERSVAWVLLVTILGLTLGLVYLNVQYNYWNRNFFNALEQKDGAAFWTLIPQFFGLSVLTVAGGALQAYLTQMLQMRWRIWLTHEYLDEWYADRSYYHLEHTPYGTDNPDQRIAEDLRQFAINTVDLSLGLLHNTVTLVSFIAILWSVSSVWSFAASGTTVSIPGDMVWAALLYAALGSAAAYWVGRPLIGLRFQQERLEADMRYSLMRTREYAEGIALYRGEDAERVQVNQRIEGLRRNWWQIMRASLKLNGLSGAYTQIGILVPYFLASPRYFAGNITLGGLTQIAGAFETVRTALSWFVFNFQALAAWKASVDRLLTFHAAIGQSRRAACRSSIVTTTDARDALAVTDLDVRRPDGTVIFSGATFEVRAGDRLMIQGPSGAGKSTLLRVLAGLWPYGGGRIEMPPSDECLFLPQLPYLPVARLVDAVIYPAPPGAIPDTHAAAALRTVGLSALVARLHEHANWSQVLSGGEQQKLAVARVLLHRPRWLFLDETTAALDPAAEAALYRLLKDTCTDCTVVSVAHRPDVAAWHDRILEMADGRLVQVRRHPRGACQG